MAVLTSKAWAIAVTPGLPILLLPRLQTISAEQIMIEALHKSPAYSKKVSVELDSNALPIETVPESPILLTERQKTVGEQITIEVLDKSSYLLQKNQH